MLSLFFASEHGNSAQAQSTCRAFPQTGKSVCGKFLAYWDAHGGLMQQGYPISNEFREVCDVDGKTYTVQYFERAVFELHPENQPPYDVLLSLLGSTYYRQRYPNGAPEQPQPTDQPSVVFPETGKELQGRFLEYWRTHGGLAQQGYPISNQFSEKSALDGKTYTVQYFERAVFEYHPDNKPPFDVLLSQLGTLQFKRKYPGDEPANPTATAPAGSDEWSALRRRPLNLPTVAPGSSCPTSGGKSVSPDFGIALGDGPLYPVSFYPDGTYYYAGATQEGGWYLLKVLWISSPDYSGPALVRGKQIDGPNELRFGEGPNPQTELRLNTANSNNRTGTGWRDWPGYTRLRAPGCYAYQVDGNNFSRVIVFKATDAMPPPPNR
jgi:hypothetical protein